MLIYIFIYIERNILFIYECVKVIPVLSNANIKWSMDVTADILRRGRRATMCEAAEYRHKFFRRTHVE